MIRLYLGKIINRIRLILKKSTDTLQFKLILVWERIEAHRLRKEVIKKKKGVTVINKQIKKSLRE